MDRARGAEREAVQLLPSAPTSPLPLISQEREPQSQQLACFPPLPLTVGKGPETICPSEGQEVLPHRGELATTRELIHVHLKTSFLAASPSHPPVSPH